MNSGENVVEAVVESLTSENVAAAIAAANLDAGSSTLLNGLLATAQENPEILKSIMEQLKALTQ